MSETDTYYRYKYDRVLIETSRMYRPMFAPAVVQLTGAQVEMLRNMTQYLNRPNTYVEEYEFDKYLTPDAGQFDGIQAIVANLEEKLMGNENVIWGYQDRMADRVTHTKVGDADYDMDMPQVPAGEVWVVTSIASRNSTTTGQHEYLLGDGVTYYPVYPYGVPAANEWRVGDALHIVMKEDDWMRVVFRDCINNDVLIGIVLGYKMAVP